jgi:hypothetical protein
MRAIYVDKHVPRIILKKPLSRFGKIFAWMPLSSARTGKSKAIKVILQA